ncbi:hypothetical protein CPB84DRAFT_1778077 [Gymnopilus junonius]|uniref:Uncharacterized protein n=1 Tax=Gymnopilus junonius TaxID=109634 RepID=A0A9P5NQ01_GYMJU|nr:hypothetical protein CPB84DRAFT_1778053 [Gymnopilus junonius]KAF8901196.1 hypothetical protein CPB84DRAFT_1778077 [Gymnopilus junonius]
MLNRRLRLVQLNPTPGPLQGSMTRDPGLRPGSHPGKQSQRRENKSKIAAVKEENMISRRKLWQP